MYGLLAAGIIAVAASGCSKSDSAVPESGDTQVSMAVKPTDIVRGDPKAPLVMIEYASMTCPHCARFEKDVMPKIVANYINTGKLRYIFREYPLDGAARMASALARCETGDKFYSMIDYLFLNQSQWIHDFNNDGQLSQEDVIQGLVQMGRVSGLSEQQVQACVNDPKNLAIVDANWQEAQNTYNVMSTPTFFLNGTKHVGEWEWGELDGTIKQMLAKPH